MVKSDKIQLTRLDFIKNTITLRGEPFSLDDYPMHEIFYAVDYTEVLWKCGRQVAKTETLKNIILANSALISDFSTLYVSPSKTQTTRFSRSRLQKTLSRSKDLKPFLSTTETPDGVSNVLMHIFQNGSEIHLTYAAEDPDRARGIPADMVAYDEVQDIDHDLVIPVINECVSGSPYGYEMYLGTAKSSDNTIEYLWQKSTQTEWAVKCPSCKKHNIYTDERCIGEHGILCLSCGEYVNVRHGIWVDMNPDARLKGFHIPQVIIPANIENKRRFSKIKNKINDPQISKRKIMNEVFGMPYGTGASILNPSLIKRRMGTYQARIQNMRKPPKPNRKEIGLKSSILFAGIDWSGGGQSMESFTVVWFWGVDSTGLNARTVGWHKFTVDDLEADIPLIAYCISNYGCRAVISDAENKLANSMLASRIGPQRLFPLQWGMNPKLAHWNGVDRYLGNRTGIIDLFVKWLIDDPGPVLPSDTPLAEFTCMREEETSSGRRVWRKVPSTPNDSLVAAIYGWLCWQLTMGFVDGTKPVNDEESK